MPRPNSDRRPLRVLEASALGMCFGVRDALAIAREVSDPRQVTIHGELVHNEQVLAELRQSGFVASPESDRRLPTTERVLVTAHGISDRERRRLATAGKQLIDTTCPLVQRVHEAARQLAASTDLVVILGRPGHVEVRGLTDDLTRCVVVEHPEDVATWLARRLGVVCQTTLPPRRARDLLDAIRTRNPLADVRFVDTICEPTKQRQQAAEAVAAEADAVVVIGGEHSNNTRELTLLCERLGTPAHQVQTAEDLDPTWFTDCATVGVTAGTSTPESTVRAVVAALGRIATGRS
ncbi:MAG: 4-hydroxy-3-methylbut-2-enyl diphosphate reductase [Planctomycetota bacterium]